MGRTNGIAAESMKTSLDQICINVSDLERAVRFYEQALGLAVTHRIEIPGVSEVVLAGAAAVTPPQRLEQWPVTVAFIRDPDGYQIEIIEQHAS